jgi:hypothetical protein
VESKEAWLADPEQVTGKSRGITYRERKCFGITAG